MQTHVEFRSDRFPPVEGEDEGLNPGRHGKRLAQFIQRGLTERGIDVGANCRRLGLVRAGQDTSSSDCGSGAANYEEYADGFLCFIEPQKACRLEVVQEN
jgi:hypothetical protein